MLNKLTENQSRLEGMIKEQTIQIFELLKKFRDIETKEDSKVSKGKEKKKIDKSKPFYHVTIYFLLILLFLYPSFIFIYIIIGCH